jgi:ISXO2-like transposase domain
MTSLKPGISALQLQGQLGLTRFETAWFLLHKLRRAMVNPDRSRLSGTVEVDETWVGGKQAGLKGGRQRKGRKAIEVVVAVERREHSLGRLRLEIIRDDGSETLYDFIRRNVEPGSLIVSDAWQGYSGIEPEIYDHQSVSQAAQKRAGGSPRATTASSSSPWGTASGGWASRTSATCSATTCDASGSRPLSQSLVAGPRLWGPDGKGARRHSRHLLRLRARDLQGADQERADQERADQERAVQGLEPGPGWLRRAFRRRRPRPWSGESCRARAWARCRQCRA